MLVERFRVLNILSRLAPSTDYLISGIASKLELLPFGISCTRYYRCRIILYSACGEIWGLEHFIEACPFYRPPSTLESCSWRAAGLIRTAINVLFGSPGSSELETFPYCACDEIWDLEHNHRGLPPSIDHLNSGILVLESETISWLNQDCIRCTFDSPGSSERESLPYCACGEF